MELTNYTTVSNHTYACITLSGLDQGLTADYNITFLTLIFWGLACIGNEKEIIYLVLLCLSSQLASPAWNPCIWLKASI